MFAIDVVTNEINAGTLQKILYGNDIVLIAESKAEQHKEFYTWKSALESKIGQISINPSSGIEPCGICGRKTMSNAVLRRSCFNWIDER